MTARQTSEEEAPPRRRQRLWSTLRKRPVRIAAALLIIALLAEYLVIPELVDASKNFYLLGQIGAQWVVAGVALEALSLFCYALMNRALLPGTSPSLSKLFRIDLSAAAVAHVLPAGTVGSAGIGYSLFTAEGVPGTDAAVMMATKGMGSTVVLNVLLWLSLVISIPLAGFHPIYITVAVAGAVALAAATALVLPFTLGKQSSARIVRAIGNAIPGVGGDKLADIVFKIGTNLADLARDRRVLVSAIGWASANWLLDAASLWCFVAAFGRFANPVELFAAYGIANVVGVLPITPAGLGVIDSLTPILLVSFGLTRNVAILGVLAWRLVNFWLPIPAGAVAYASLKTPRGPRLRSMHRSLSEMLARHEASFAPEWRVGRRGAGGDPRLDARGDTRGGSRLDAGGDAGGSRLDGGSDAGGDAGSDAHGGGGGDGGAASDPGGRGSA
jgi:uncharacterized protein (TIRG00374 family)